jgi:mevalonate pyrophosphate decarboxylase
MLLVGSSAEQDTERIRRPTCVCEPEHRSSAESMASMSLMHHLYPCVLNQHSEQQLSRVCRVCSHSSSRQRTSRKVLWKSEPLESVGVHSLCTQGQE